MADGIVGSVAAKVGIRGAITNVTNALPEKYTIASNLLWATTQVINLLGLGEIKTDQEVSESRLRREVDQQFRQLQANESEGDTAVPQWSAESHCTDYIDGSIIGLTEAGIDGVEGRRINYGDAEKVLNHRGEIGSKYDDMKDKCIHAATPTLPAPRSHDQNSVLPPQLRRPAPL